MTPAQQRDALLELINATAETIEHGGTVRARMLRKGAEMVMQQQVEPPADPFIRQRLRPQ